MKPEQQRQLRESLNWLKLGPDQLVRLLAKQEKIRAHYQTFKKLIDNLMDVKDKIMNEMKNTENMMVELQSELTHEQVAKFLLLSDKVKLKHEFDIFTLWEIRKQKVSNLQPVIERLEMAQDGRTVLKPKEEDVSLSQFHHGASLGADAFEDEDDNSQSGLPCNLDSE